MIAKVNIVITMASSPSGNPSSNLMMALTLMIFANHFKFVVNYSILHKKTVVVVDTVLQAFHLT